ncbi:MAG: FkbM family methyltransferase [Moorea sp. SIO3G5]|nr:FkbM family methyltransferase [Moorena sp. SIO3G5]
MYKVSVIMPVWNSERYLAEAVDSVLNQTLKDFELIALDDGSTDKSLQILHDFAKQDSRIKVIASEHQGYSPLLNLGLSMAKGEYIARMDSDDVCFPERFEKQVKFLDEHPDYVAVGSQALRIDPEGDPIGYAKFPTDHENIDASQIEGQGKIMHPASMIRNDALIKVDGYRPEFEPGEDFDLFLRLAEVGKLANSSETLLKYRMHCKNVTVTKKERHQRVKQKALEEAYQRRTFNQDTVPVIKINDSPSNQSDFRFLWMHTALSSGFYSSARKNAWIGFKSASITQNSIKNLVLGLGGAEAFAVKNMYNKKPIFSIIIERPLSLFLGFIGRLLDYLKAAIDRIRSKIPKEAYTLALLNSFLIWNKGKLERPKKGFFRAIFNENNKDIYINIRSQSSDIMTFAEVLIAKEYFPVVELITKKSDKDIHLIIDAGANIGISSVFFKAYFPDASVICIEPDTENIALLKENISDNKLTNCKVIQGGLWYKDCQLGLLHDFRDGLSWSIRVAEQADGTIKGIGILSLLEWCGNKRIGLLKIDIEGSEFNIFRQSEVISKLLAKTDFLVAEIHQEFGSCTEIQSILFENGFFSFESGNLLIASRLKHY